MNYRMLWRLLSIILLIEAGLLTLPLIVAAIYSEPLLPFLLTIGILIVCALPGLIRKPADSRIYSREGFLCSAGAWILMSLFGALPFVFDGAIPNYIDAFFETVSGFTTTGASILTEIESLHRGILFWRSFTHMIGGMGVLVFMLAIIPSSDGRAMNLLRAEVPGPQKGKLVPKIRQTALILYGIYLALAAIEVVALRLTGLPLYDCFINAFGTAGTGGFSVLNHSIAGYNNPAAEWVMAVFLLLFGVNFNIYFYLLARRFTEIKKNEELRVYLLIILVSCTIVTVNTIESFATVGDAIRGSVFNVLSVMSTAGFSTVDYNLWPTLSKTVLVMLMMIGGCAGSTAGGLKVSRVIILIKNAVNEIRHVLKPNSVRAIRLDGEPLGEETCRGAANYFSLYFLIACASTVLIAVFDHFDLETNLTAMLACLNNIGPGFGKVGPTGNYSGYTIFSKIVLSLDMLFGRLEIIPMILFFSPASWKKT